MNRDRFSRKSRTGRNTTYHPQTPSIFWGPPRTPRATRLVACLAYQAPGKRHIETLAHEEIKGLAAVPASRKLSPAGVEGVWCAFVSGQMGDSAVWYG